MITALSWTYVSPVSSWGTRGARSSSIPSWLGDSRDNKEKMLQIENSSGVWEFKVHSGKGLRMWGRYGSQGMFVTHGAVKP